MDVYGNIWSEYAPSNKKNSNYQAGSLWLEKTYAGLSIYLYTGREWERLILESKCDLKIEMRSQSETEKRLTNKVARLEKKINVMTNRYSKLLHKKEDLENRIKNIKTADV